MIIINRYSEKRTKKGDQEITIMLQMALLSLIFLNGVHFTCLSVSFLIFTLAIWLLMLEGTSFLVQLHKYVFP